MSVQIPQELLQQIFFYISGNQKALHACSLTSVSWYSASIAYLYEDPVVTGKNYNAFVQAICPSVNAHVRRNGLAELVRKLDMSSLVHNGSKSLTARLLGRVKIGLEEFVAPQASFAYVLHFVEGFAVVYFLDNLPPLRKVFFFADILQGELPCSSLEMLQPSSPRSLFRFRIHINDRSLTFDQPASKAGKPMSA